MIDLFIVLLSYLLGGLSTGYYLVWLLKRRDIRDYGSGATGATNVGRLLGKKGFLMTLLGDVLKGCVTPIIAIYLGLSNETVMLSLIAVVAGHIWPVQLGFRGGKGIATALGGIVIIDPQLTLILIACGMALFLITRKFTLSGLIIILGAPILSFLMLRPRAQSMGISLITTLILIAHWKNIYQMMSEALNRRK